MSLFAALVLFFCHSGPCRARQAASEPLTSEEVMILLNLLIEKAESLAFVDGQVWVACWKVWRRPAGATLVSPPDN